VTQYSAGVDKNPFNCWRRKSNTMDIKGLESVQQALNSRRVLLGSVLLLGVLIFFASFPHIIGAVNTVTRADLSQHVSNKTCGLQLNASCPGTLECFTDFNVSRVGTNITGGRCVTPAYTTRYCGIFAANIRHTSEPPSMGPCFSHTDRYGTGPTDYKDALIDVNLYDRVFNTDQNGPDLIRRHKLALAAEDQNTK